MIDLCFISNSHLNFLTRKGLDSVERQEIYGCQKIAGSKYYELIDLGNDVCHFRDKCGHMFVRNHNQCYSKLLKRNKMPTNVIKCARFVETKNIGF